MGGVGVGSPRQVSTRPPGGAGIQLEAEEESLAPREGTGWATAGPGSPRRGRRSREAPKSRHQVWGRTNYSVRSPPFSRRLLRVEVPGRVPHPQSPGLLGCQCLRSGSQRRPSARARR